MDFLIVMLQVGYGGDLRELRHRRDGGPRVIDCTAATARGPRGAVNRPLSELGQGL